ncbi:MAG: aminotransferase class I/II-fold pyridoxal phosphate-dependent enzyme [Candidatus Levybacteria bacterium]|nr:aminotransferase class I/II-fold pyridoxal phosphate-dependent enzyme [Candidatus Levybacteria bacterium]
MNITPAKRLENFPEYIFSKLNKAVMEVEKQSGRNVLNLGTGNPNIKPSKKYIAKLQEYIAEPDAHIYPGYGPRPEFRDALIAWHKKRFGVDLESDEVYQLIGEKDAIGMLPLAFLNKGDEVLTPDPGYQGFAGPALMVGAKVITYDLLPTNEYKIDMRELKSKVTAKTKFMWVNFPSNPLGQIATLEELEQLIAFAKEHNIFIIYDNAYSEITFDGYVAPSILQIEGAKEVAVEINSFSKAYSFAGYRIGWIVGNKDIIASLAKVKSQMDSGLAIPMQKLGAYALTHKDVAWHENMIRTYDARRKTVATYLSKLGLQSTLPKASLYIWAKIPNTETNSWTYSMKLLQEKQILVTPGTAFGKNGDRFVRVSICGTIDEIDTYFA